MQEQIKTFEDACTALGLNPTVLPDVSLLPEKDRKPIIAHYKLVKIVEALNNGWVPNWNDHDEYKYNAYFEIEASKEQPSGFGFSSTNWADWFTYSFVGARLCFKSSDLALYAGKQFADLYKEYFLIAK